MNNSIIKNNLLDEWLALEEVFSINNYNPVGDSEVIYLEGVSKQPRVLFCAPHALNHYRDSQLKIADVFTGSLCQLLAKQTDQPGLVAIAPTKNFDNLGFGHDYVSHIRNKVNDGVLIVDIHGMSDLHGCDICIGTGPNPSDRVNKLAENLANDLSEYKVSINYPFDASAKHTVTNFVQTDLRGDSIQIEITSRLRQPHHNGQDSKIFLEKITDVINGYLE